MDRRAVVLLSGGLDSATTLAVARSEGFATYALSFRYGQRHAIELAAAARVAASLGAQEHVVIPLDAVLFGSSALTSDTPVPKDETLEEIGVGIPVTYVPARNTVFLSIALAWAESLGAQDIFIGVTAVDYSGYPDCRPEFIDAFEKMAAAATKAAVSDGHRVHVHAPLIDLQKVEIVRLGLDLGVDYSLTHSCYDPSPNGVACGRCHSCSLRRDAFAKAGLSDPIEYADAYP